MSERKEPKYRATSQAARTVSSVAGKIGLPPGALVHVGEEEARSTKITLFDYNADGVQESVLNSIQEILPYLDRQTITWVNIQGLQDASVIEFIGQHFAIHPLVQEDILNTHQRPKFEEYEDYLYFVLKSVSWDEAESVVGYEQVSVLLFQDFVFTFKEEVNDLFKPIQQRLENSKGRMRSLGGDYLCYAIVDSVVDQNFLVLDGLDICLEEAEDELLDNPTPRTMALIQHLKRELIYMRRAVSPLRDMLQSMQKSETELIEEKTRVFFSDVLDHVLRVTENIETHREILADLIDIYISHVSNKMNEVMKVLTVFTSIFIPLSFLAGVYGMNFEFMPELKWRWGYPLLWLVFLTIPAILLMYFRKKKWL